MTYSKDLVIIPIIMVRNKLKNIKKNIIKTSGNLKPITFTSLVSIKSIKSIIQCMFLLLNNFFLLKKTQFALKYEGGWISYA